MNHRQKAEELFVVMRGYRTLEPCLKILSDALKEVEEETFARAVEVVEKRLSDDLKFAHPIGLKPDYEHGLNRALDALREEAGKEGVEV